MATFKQKVKLVFVSYGSREPGSGAGKAYAEALQQEGVNSVFPQHGPRMAGLATEPARICAFAVQELTNSANCVTSMIT